MRLFMVLMPKRETKHTHTQKSSAQKFYAKKSEKSVLERERDSSRMSRKKYECVALWVGRKWNSSTGVGAD